ncbi:MAG: 3-phosphoshikimate 1-carboxyvinyltransferase [Coriobacteriaceae bacterium]|jgi:3-phosphoshikimate 1-carboxyvinyltransferase|nr:3-phosphoshikimate 1-carboxyvinyltransferase [Coriobacteriaceae bacterium]
MPSKTETAIAPLAAPLRGVTSIPGDKSISHRAILFSAMAEGTSELSGVLDSGDVRSSIAAVQKLGAQVDLKSQADGSLAGAVTGWGETGPIQPDGPIDCGNSGTTARLLMGVLAPWDIEVTITGDDALQKRPMRRITAPLMKMGARFIPEGQELLPITMRGTSTLRAITHDAPMASAQLKTAVLLAGIYAQGTTTLNEPSPSRNHTELMLPEYGVVTTAAACTASVKGPSVPKACAVKVPGDPSSAAFLACAAVLTCGSDIAIEDVSLNTARIGFVRTLERMGADVLVRHKGTAGKEPFGTIEARHSGTLHGCEVPADKIATMVDEVPVLSLVAAFAKGVTVFREVDELRVKETDRIEAILEGLGLIGVDAWMDGSDLYVEGQPGLSLPPDTVFDSKKDHRLAMTWAIAGLAGKVAVQVKNFDSVKISYPHFLHDIERLTR